MNIVNKLLNVIVALGLVYIFYEAASNFWIALPYLIIFTLVLIPTLIKSDAKYFSKLIDYVFCVIAKIFSVIFRKIEIDRYSVKWGLFWGGIFYVMILFQLLGGIASFEKCLNDNGINNISYCYATYERRELTSNEN